jgi:hypothetical protein
MKKAPTKISSVKHFKISDATQQAYENRDPALDNDPDCPQVPPEYWNNAVVGKYYRPLKQEDHWTG